MSLKNMTLKSQTTSIDVVGGTPIVFAEDGVAIQNGVHLMVPADEDFKTRRVITAKSRNPALDPAKNRYSKSKRSMSFALPVVDTVTNEVTFRTIRIELEMEAAALAADVSEILCLGAQMCISDDTAQFWVTGARS